MDNHYHSIKGMNYFINETHKMCGSEILVRERENKKPFRLYVVVVVVVIFFFFLRYALTRTRLT